MGTRKYSSYAQIDRELEILKIEKDISYQRIVLGYHRTKESIAPHHLLNNFLESFKTAFSGSFGTILNIAVPFAINWIINKKRGR
ncbi:DUF6327 family protein [Flavobacterium hiemivividum]|uniref:Uncharacterized protein n=1 Tax=Flavobacterium hiemivividum TaxID=2541734 RepID=A0A4R5D0D6_9FLAO|nr:DUF6327 family protein [Flavobacterium hiemivividum]TDE04881.1 hypothetical protein E0F98_05940 [Flavobacterium hiemivividum]